MTDRQEKGAAQVGSAGHSDGCGFDPGWDGKRLELWWERDTLWLKRTTSGAGWEQLEEGMGRQGQRDSVGDSCLDPDYSGGKDGWGDREKIR